MHLPHPLVKAYFSVTLLSFLIDIGVYAVIDTNGLGLSSQTMVPVSCSPYTNQLMTSFKTVRLVIVACLGLRTLVTVLLLVYRSWQFYLILTPKWLSSCAASLNFRRWAFILSSVCLLMTVPTLGHSIEFIRLLITCQGQVKNSFLVIAVLQGLVLGCGMTLGCFDAYSLLSHLPTKSLIREPLLNKNKTELNQIPSVIYQESLQESIINSVASRKAKSVDLKPEIQLVQLHNVTVQTPQDDPILNTYQPDTIQTKTIPNIQLQNHQLTHQKLEAFQNVSINQSDFNSKSNITDQTPIASVSSNNSSNAKNFPRTNLVLERPQQYTRLSLRKNAIVSEVVGSISYTPTSKSENAKVEIPNTIGFARQKEFTSTTSAQSQSYKSKDMMQTQSHVVSYKVMPKPLTSNTAVQANGIASTQTQTLDFSHQVPNGQQPLTLDLIRHLIRLEKDAQPLDLNKISQNSSKNSDDSMSDKYHQIISHQVNSKMKAQKINQNIAKTMKVATLNQQELQRNNPLNPIFTSKIKNLTKNSDRTKISYQASPVIRQNEEQSRQILNLNGIGSKNNRLLTKTPIQSVRSLQASRLFKQHNTILENSGFKSTIGQEATVRPFQNKVETSNRPLLNESIVVEIYSKETVEKHESQLVQKQNHSNKGEKQEVKQSDERQPVSSISGNQLPRDMSGRFLTYFRNIYDKAANR